LLSRSHGSLSRVKFKHFYVMHALYGTTYTILIADTPYNHFAGKGIINKGTVADARDQASAAVMKKITDCYAFTFFLE
jgi:hypothetical protein